MKKIGILGGLGPESTIEYYRLITRRYYELRGDYNYPEIIIYSLTFAPFINCGYESATAVEAAIESLARAGADFVVAACNSVHIVYDEVAPSARIPWVSIIDVAGEAVRKAGMRKVGLLGTVFTMSKGFFQARLAMQGIETIVPDADDQQMVSDIIYTELVRDVRTETSRATVLACAEKLRRKGAEGIVLGCTELPFLIQQKHTEMPLFDTTALHAEKALEMALEED